MRGRSNNRGGPWRGGRGPSRGRGFGGFGNRGSRPSFGGNSWNYGNNPSNFGGEKWMNRPKRETPGKRLSEAEIGVTEYMSEHEGFNGIIKSRYSDFHVAEINENGEVAKLTDLSAPEPLEEEQQVNEDEDLLLSKYNVEILPMETWNNINKLIVDAEAATEKVEIDVSNTSKEDRTKIHDAVKKAFGDAIVGSTVNIDDKKLMRFEKYRKGVRIDHRVKWIWPGEFVHFIVHKENCDTMAAASKISERLRSHIKPHMLGYAGTKDRRAKTSQWFSVRKVDPRKMAAAMRGTRDLAIGNYSFHSHHLKLGMLRGNEFRIALRNVTAPEAVIEAACAQLRDRGFVNYYGLQRFGTRCHVPTFEIGRQLLLQNFRQAINLILEPHEGPLEHALQLYKSMGAGRAVESIPRFTQNTTEARLIAALAQRPADHLTALHKVPRNTRLLYLHSYQSLVWNRCVTERVRRAGLQPTAGDLVPLQPCDVREEIDNVESDTEDTDSPESEKESETQSENKRERVKEKIPVKVLTQEDVDSKRYTIYDIVMPLPGYNIEYPPNMKDYYEELLTKDGLTLQLRCKHKSYCMGGAYRRVAVRPRELAWRRVAYDDPFADLLLSDLDALRGTQLAGILPDGKYKALLLTFTLPASCYATMALRELLRVDTSCDKQAEQNNYHKRKVSECEDTGSGQKRAREQSEDTTVSGNTGSGQKARESQPGDASGHKDKGGSEKRTRESKPEDTVGYKDMGSSQKAREQPDITAGSENTDSVQKRAREQSEDTIGHKEKGGCEKRARESKPEDAVGHKDMGSGQKARESDGVVAGQAGGSEVQSESPEDGDSAGNGEEVIEAAENMEGESVG